MFYLTFQFSETNLTNLVSLTNILRDGGWLSCHLRYFIKMYTYYQLITYF